MSYKRRNNFQIEKVTGKTLTDELDRISKAFREISQFDNLLILNLLTSRNITFSGTLNGTGNIIDHQLVGRFTVKRYQGQTVDLIRAISEANAVLFSVDKDGDVTATSITLSGLTASRLVATDASKILVSTITAGNLLSSVTGTTGTAGNLVFSASPTFTGTVAGADINLTGNATIGGLTASRLVATDGSKILVSTITLANLASSISDVTGTTGTGKLVLDGTPTLVTPNIGAATGTSVNLTGAGTFGGNVKHVSSTAGFAYLAAINTNTAQTAGFFMAEVDNGSTPTYFQRFGSTHATKANQTDIVSTGAMNFSTAGGNINFTPGSGTALLTGSLTVTSDVAVNGGDLTSTATTFNLLDATVTTLNLGGAATAINLGATSGTLTLDNPTVVGSQTTVNLWDTTSTTVNFAGAATTLNVGATSGTLTLDNPTVVGSQTTVNLWNTTSTTVNAFGAATTLNLGASGGNTKINGIKKYVATVTQTGTGAPSATVLENTLSGTPTWARSSAGVYTLTLTGEWTANKTFVITGLMNGSFATNTGFMSWARTSTNVLTFTVTGADYIAGTDAATDGLWTEMGIEVRVYP